MIQAALSWRLIVVMCEESWSRGRIERIVRLHGDRWLQETRWIEMAIRCSPCQWLVVIYLQGRARAVKMFVIDMIALTSKTRLISRWLVTRPRNGVA